MINFSEKLIQTLNVLLVLSWLGGIAYWLPPPLTELALQSNWYLNTFTPIGISITMVLLICGAIFSGYPLRFIFMFKLLELEKK